MAHQAYLFKPRLRNKGVLDMSYEGTFKTPANPASTQETRIVQHSEDRPKLDHLAPSNDVFRYNPLHDMESLWWIAVHCVLKNPIEDAAGNVYEPSDTQKKFTDGLFGTRTQRHLAL